jgi:DNA-binding transcriptional LysR family regulator
MEIKQLRTFLAVANARSFLGAANALYISRQAVSKTITQLEDELGVELFARSQNGAMMTPAGIFFYPRAVSLVAEFDKLLTDMQEMDHSYRPKIQLCMSLGIFGLFARRLTEYARMHRMEMDLQFRGCLDVDCSAMLTDRRADATLSFTPQNSRAADPTLLMESPVRFLVRQDSPLAGERVGAAELLQQPLLLYTGGWDRCLWWPEAPRPMDQACSDLDYLLSLLRDGQGVMPLPAVLAEPQLSYAAALETELEPEPGRIYYCTLYPTYYNAINYDLMGSVFRDVLSQPLF